VIFTAKDVEQQDDEDYNDRDTEMEIEIAMQDSIATASAEETKRHSAAPQMYATGAYLAPQGYGSSANTNSGNDPSLPVGYSVYGGIFPKYQSASRPFPQLSPTTGQRASGFLPPSQKPLPSKKMAKKPSPARSHDRPSSATKPEPKDKPSKGLKSSPAGQGHFAPRT
jgi:hypothetical protein